LGPTPPSPAKRRKEMQDLKVGDFAHYDGGTIVRIVGLQPVGGWEKMRYKCFHVLYPDLSKGANKTMVNVRERNLKKINLQSFLNRLDEVKTVLLDEEKKVI
jgi:hypothetical protein